MGHRVCRAIKWAEASFEPLKATCPNRWIMGTTRPWPQWYRAFIATHQGQHEPIYTPYTRSERAGSRERKGVPRCAKNYQWRTIRFSLWNLGPIRIKDRENISKFLVPATPHTNLWNERPWGCYAFHRTHRLPHRSNCPISQTKKRDKTFVLPQYWLMRSVKTAQVNDWNLLQTTFWFSLLCGVKQVKPLNPYPCPSLMPIFLYSEL